MEKITELLSSIPEGDIKIIQLGEAEDQGLLKLGRGNIISKKEIESNPGEYPVYSSSAVGDGEVGRYGKYMFDDERITWSIDGGGKLFYRNGMKYSVTNVGGWLKVLSAEINTKYLFYALYGQWTGKKFDYTNKAHPSVIRGEYYVPIIPITYQEKIVEFLDEFMVLSDEYLSVLKKEIEARQKQKDYYLDLLLSDNGNGIVYNLEDICKIVDCPHTSPKWKTEGIPVIRNYNLVNGKIDTTNLSYVDEDDYKERVKRIVPQKNDILFSREAPIGNVGIVPENFQCCQGQRVVLLRADEKIVLADYLVHALQGGFVKTQIYKVNQIGVTVSNFNISDLKKLQVIIPSKDKQAKIIGTLSEFSNLAGEVIKCIEEECEKREKQINYYYDSIFRFAAEGGCK